MRYYDANNIPFYNAMKNTFMSKETISTDKSTEENGKIAALRL